MVTPAQFVFFLTCLLSRNTALSPPLESSSSDHRENVFISAHIGGTVTLPCFYDRVYLQYVLWYKYILGQKPKPICFYSKFKTEVTFYNSYKENPRFTMKSLDQSNNLTISNVKLSDSGTYFCVSGYQIGMEFSSTITVDVKGPGSTIQTSVDQSSSENIHAGDSVTLNCTVHTGSCDGEHRVYWFKDSEDSHPGLIYTHGGRNDQCERNNNIQTHSCDYNLHMKNLTESHAGIYYCAVVSCGHILFGNGTKLDLTPKEGNFPPLVYFLSGVLTASLIFLTSYIILKSCKSKKDRSETPSLTRTKDEDHHCYSALKGNKMSGSRMLMEDTWSQCVYFRTKQQSL